MTTNRTANAGTWLLPEPVEFIETGEFLDCTRGLRLDGTTDDSRVESTAATIRDRLQLAAIRAGPAPTPVEHRAPPVLQIRVDARACGRIDEYRLTVSPEGVQIVGRSPRACFYGLMTLAQLPVRQRGLPCCRICDFASFATRGLLHDVTRGKVPTLATLQRIADRLASWKVNELQLYIEHAFRFSFDAEICGPDEGLTPDEVRELDRYCQERFINLVPAVATLGHMGRILAMPRYRHLAEIEPAKVWSELSWPERARGFTLDCMNPESHHLVERIWSDILDAFTSPVVNICGDEPWDLGKGKNLARFADSGTGTPYIDHVLRTHQICQSRGRRAQVWSDVVRNHPDLFDRLPDDLTVLHWGYDDRSDYEGTHRFVEAGLPTFVCPGTSGWKRILNALNAAERNIASFAAAGARHGAAGLLNTDWGDHGHFNLLTCSWHGIALGAALGWRADHPTGEAFDRRFARAAWGLDDPAGMALLRDASDIAGCCETWRCLWQAPASLVDDPTLPNEANLEAAGSAASAFQRWVASAPVGDPEARADLGELSVAACFTELFAAMVGSASRRAAGQNEGEVVTADWATRASNALSAYQACWLARNKSRGLADIRAALERVIELAG